MTASDAILYSVQSENYRYATLEKERAEIMKNGLLYSLAEKQHSPLRAEEAANIFCRVSGEKLTSVSFAYFCRCLAEKEQILLPDWTVEMKEEAPPVVSFMRSRDTNEIFAALKKEAVWTERSVSSAADVCLDVSEGRCRGGILPVFSQIDGPLLYFRKMIRRYELCISAVFEKYFPETDNVLQYALLKRENVSSAQKRTCIDILFPTSAFNQLGVLTDSARTMEMPMKGFHVLPTDSGSGKEQILMTLAVRHSLLPALRLFLAIAFPEAEITGYYHVAKI